MRLPRALLQTLVCRRTLAGHTDDILSLGGISIPVAAPDVNQLLSPGSPTAAVIAGVSPAGLPLPLPPGSAGGGSFGGPGSPRTGLERALLFVSAAADGSVRLWSGVCHGQRLWVAWAMLTLWGRQAGCHHCSAQCRPIFTIRCGLVPDILPMFAPAA